MCIICVSLFVWHLALFTAVAANLFGGNPYSLEKLKNIICGGPKLAKLDFNHKQLIYRDEMSINFIYHFFNKLIEWY